MEKTIIIRDYVGNPIMIMIKDFETVDKIYINIITGDEILHVIRKDFSEDIYDSCNHRMIDFDDGCYYIYWPKRGINLLDDPKWCKYKNSYNRMLQGIFGCCETIRTTPTIIPADKEEVKKSEPFCPYVPAYCDVTDLNNCKDCEILKEQGYHYPSR